MKRRTSKGAELRKEKGKSGTIYFVHHMPSGRPRWTVFIQTSDGFAKTSLRQSARDCGGKSWDDIRAQREADEAYDKEIIRLCRRPHGATIQQLRRVPGWRALGSAKQGVTLVGNRHGYRFKATGVWGSKRYHLV